MTGKDSFYEDVKAAGYTTEDVAAMHQELKKPYAKTLEEYPLRKMFMGTKEEKAKHKAKIAWARENDVLLAHFLCGGTADYRYVKINLS